MKFFFLFLLVPILEIVVFIKINQILGLPITVFFIFFTAVLGAFTVKKQGLGVILELKNQFNGNIGNPFKPLISGILILISGCFLLTPVFITDVIGFLLLVPKIRAYFVLKIINKIDTHNLIIH